MNELRRTEALNTWNIERNDPDLVATVEELGSVAASDCFACLKIVNIPDDTMWTIENYDGVEEVSEVHKTWS